MLTSLTVSMIGGANLKNLEEDLARAEETVAP
jgi:hypothetical protein